MAHPVSLGPPAHPSSPEAKQVSSLSSENASSPGLNVSSTVLVSGSAIADVCGTREPLSFWGGYDPETGTVIDRRHELVGEVLTGKIFVVPHGKGSSTGSAVLLDALVSGNAPAGIILSRVDEIIALGVVIFEEFYGRSIPVSVLEDDDFSLAMQGRRIQIHPDGTVVISTDEGTVE